jgi:hypothetical protein
MASLFFLNGHKTFKAIDEDKKVKYGGTKHLKGKATLINFFFFGSTCV